MVDQSVPEQTSVAVIGGGIAGLSAALHLAERGARVVLFEPSNLGGKLRTSTFAGRPVDEGPDAFLAKVPWATALAAAVGLGDRLVAPATGRAHVFTSGSLHALPAAQVMGVPTDPDADDLEAILSQAAREALRSDLTDPGAQPTTDESIGAFITRRLGREVLETLVGPLVAGINAGDVDRMSLAAVTPQLDAAARSDMQSIVAACAAQRAQAATSAGAASPVFLAPQGGMATLVDALTEQLRAVGVEIHEGAAVRALEPRTDGGWLVVADPTRGGVATDATAPHVVDAVVIATPPTVAAALLADHAPSAAELLGGIRSSSVALVTFAVDQADLARPLDGSGFLVARAEGLLLTACSWASSKWAALAPDRGDGTVLLRASAGRDGDNRIADLDDDSLAAALVADLALTMGLTAEPRATRVTRWPSAFPQYDVGHLERIDSVESAVTEAAPTVALAGCALRGIGIPASIRSGQIAAERVLAATAR